MASRTPTYLLVCLKRFVYSKAFPVSSAFCNPDTVSGRLLPWHLRFVGYFVGTAFRLLPFLMPAFTKAIPMARSGSVTARTRFLDDSVRSAVADGAKQLLILGAGFDTRPERLRDILAGVRVFEVDLPSAQAAKRAALQRAGLADDWGSVFVPVDFSNADWPDKIRQAGCELGSVRTHVLWEGVIYYLTEDAVVATLRALRKPGVSLSFDMIDKDGASGEVATDPAARAMTRHVRSVGEPVRFGVDFERIRDWAAAHGWGVTDALCGAEEVCARFYPDPEAGNEPYSFHGMASMRSTSS